MNNVRMRRALAAVVVFFLWCALLQDFNFSQEEDPLQKAQKLYDEGDYEGSVNVLDTFVAKLKIMPGQQQTIAKAYFLLAKVYYEVGDMAKTDECIRSVFETNPDFTKTETFLEFKARVQKVKEGPRKEFFEKEKDKSAGKAVKKKKFPILLVLAGVAAVAGIVYLLTSKKQENNMPNPPPFTFEYVTSWGSNGTGNGQFNKPEFIAFDPAGYCYVVDGGNHRVQKFSDSGQFVTSLGSYGFGDGNLNQPRGGIVDANFNVYITDSHNNRIQKFDSSGHFLSTLGGYGNGEGRFWGPWCMVIVQNELYLTEYNNNRVQVLDLNGGFIRKWGSLGTGNGQFNIPQGIAADGQGNIYVVDKNNNRVQKFSSGGSFLLQFGQAELIQPGGVAVDGSEYVFVADCDNNRICKYTASGGFIGAAGSWGSENGQFKGPNGLAIDVQGFLYVGDWFNHRIQKFRIK